MRATRSLKLAVLALATVVLVAACGGTSDDTPGAAASPGTITTVKVGVLGLVADAPFFVADSSGYFQQQGIKVEFSTFQSGADMIPAIASGQLDVGWGQYTAGLFNAIGRGIDVKLVASAGSVDKNTTSGLVVTTKSGIVPGDPQTLKGKTLAINGSGIGAQAYLHNVLKQAGIADKDVTLKILSLPNQVTALASGAIDGAFLVDPLIAAATAKGAAKLYGTNFQLAGDTEHQIATVLYSPQFAGKKDLANHFMTAYLKASDLVNKAFGAKDPTAKAEVAKDLMAHVATIKAATDLDGYYVTGGSAKLDTKSIDMFLGPLKELGLVTTPNVDYQKSIDASYADAAQKALGGTG